MLLQKANYINLNPFNEGLVKRPEEYLYCSFRIWTKKGIENEPLEVDIREIEWRAQP